MPRRSLAVRVLGADEWPDSAAEQRAHWRSKTPAERVEAGRKFHAKMRGWFHLKGPSLPQARRMIGPLP